MSIRSAAVLIGLLLQAALAPALWAEPPSAPKRILVLFPFDSARPSTSEILKGLEDGLLNSYGSRVTVFVEFIRPTPPVRAGFHEGLLEWFSYKYGAQTFDALCPLRPEAVTLAEQLRKRLWPSAPIVFAMLKDEYQPGFGPNESATGILWELADRQAIRAALRLLPETRHIALVGGSGAGDVEANRRLSGLIRQTVPGIDLIPLTGLSLAEVESRVGSLPENTILYQGWFDEDANGRSFTWAEVASLLSPKANRPMFSSVELAFGSGVVGGPMSSVRQGGDNWGRQVGRVLAGTSPSSLPLSTGYDVKAVDWRQLKRWHIPEDRVPPGTEIRFRDWSPWEEHRAFILGVTAAILLQALAIGFLLVERRRRSVSERAATASEELSRAILASLSGRIAILDKDGTIVRVSQNWDTPWEGEEDRVSNSAAGANYLDACRAHGDRIDGAENVARAAESVLEGRSRAEMAEYRVRLGERDRWMEARIERLDRSEGGAVVTHLDVTQMRQAELARRQAIDEIHHLNRVATVGEFAGSLAHELAQPIASILANAQAATRFADRPDADLGEIREALADIAEDDRRAGSIIDRMRKMLKKQAIPVQELDLNRTVEEVSQLVRSMVVTRAIQLRLDLAAGGVMVQGDAVTVQQVLLNLLSNGMDAVQALPKGTGSLTVITCTRDGMGEVLVEDNGPGIPEAVRQRVFESFFTTKREGLGMGLSICRSILATLGGRISAENRAGGGARFRVALPLAKTQ